MIDMPDPGSPQTARRLMWVAIAMFGNGVSLWRITRFLIRGVRAQVHRPRAQPKEGE